MAKLTQSATKIPSLPALPADTSPQLRQYLQNLGEIVEVRTGRLGDPRDRAITLRELIDSGLAEQLKVSPFDPNNPVPGFITPPGTGSGTRPPAPTGFTATAGYSNALLFWDLPDYAYYSLTEVWRHDSDVIGDATLIGVSNGTSYIDPIGGGQTRYYWIRHVSTFNVAGEWYSTAGAGVTTVADIAYTLDLLAGAITKTELVTSLTSEIEASTTSISSLHGQYTVKIDANGRVAGFGLSNTAAAYDGGIHSDFIVLSDRFSIVNQNDNGDLIVPFVVTIATTLNGESVPAGVYISEAFIKNGAIVSAKIGDAAIDTAKIANAAISTAKIDDLAVTTAKINSLAVTEAQIGALAVTEAKIGALAVTTAKIGDLSVDTIKVAGNAISDSAFANGSTGTSLTITHDARQGSVLLIGVLYPSSTTSRTVYLKRDTTTLRTFTVNSAVPIVIMYVDNPPSSTDYDYVVEGAGVAADWNAFELLLLEVVK